MSETTDPSAAAAADPPPEPPRAGVTTANLGHYERLRRSRTDRRIAGVAGGLGRHLNVDPTVLRVLLVVLCLFGGAGFVLYAAAWLLVPEEGAEHGAISTSGTVRNTLLIGAGVLALLLLVGGWHGLALVPTVVVALLVVAVLLLSEHRRGGAVEIAPGTAPPPPHPPAPAYAPGPAYAPDPAYAVAAPRPSRHGPLLFAPTLALVAVAVGLLGLIDALGASVPPAAYPALALGVVGAMLVVGSFVGRAGGLIALGLVLALGLGSTAAVAAAGWAGGSERARQVRATPASAAAVADRYAVASGQVRLDLRRVTDPGNLAGRTIRVRAGVGRLVVVLPPDGVRSQVEAEVAGPGQIELPGRTSSGFGADTSGTYGSGDGTLRVDLHAGVGQIVVRRP